ncbi:MAG: LTA synthase family protein [Bdellovibrio sp.]
MSFWPRHFLRKVLANIYVTPIWMIFVSLFLLYKICSKDSSNTLEWDLKTFFSLGAFFIFLSSLVKSVHGVFGAKQALIKFSLSFFVVFYSLLGFYHYKADLGFDFSIIADHWKFIWRPGSFKESIGVANATFSFPQYFWTVVFGVITWILVSFDLRRRTPYRNLLYAVPLVLTLAGLVFFVREPVDELSSFLQTVVYRVMPFKTAFQQKYMPPDKAPYPLMRKLTAQHGTEKKPNVFIVFIESFNANFVEAKSDSGQEFTPIYNSLIKKGLYFENFYGQSIQTGRAHFASLCGLTPGIYGKEFSEFVDKNFHCLPQILKEHGYFTVFSKANEDVHFDNTFNFTTRNGFEVMNSMGHGCAQEAQGTCWGWGIPDNLFYKRFFTFLKNEKNQRPVFATLATISSHMPFDGVPPNERMFRHPKTKRDRYSNAIHVTDRYVETFFKELAASGLQDNSIVILTGDHSYPMGEHNNFRNESYAFEENFKTPMLILDFRKNAVVQPGRVKEAYSQLNIASTVLDLVGVSAEVHFLGESLLAPAPKFISMMQPYGGIYFAVVNYPFKYVLYDRTGEEFIYNLANDPDEHLNLRGQWENLTLLEAFRHEVGKGWFNFELMKQDRIWPARQKTVKAATRSVEFTD